MPLIGFAMDIALVSKHPQGTLDQGLSKTSNCGDMIGVHRGDGGVYFSPFPVLTHDIRVYFNT